MRMRRTAGYDFATHGLPTCVTIQPRFERMLVDIPKELDIVRNTRVPLQNNHVPKIVLKHASMLLAIAKSSVHGTSLYVPWEERINVFMHSTLSILDKSSFLVAYAAIQDNNNGHCYRCRMPNIAHTWSNASSLCI